MAHKLMSKTEAEHIIVYGKNRGFSMYHSKKDNNMITVHHRDYEGKHYNIAVIPSYDEETDETSEYFYEMNIENTKDLGPEWNYSDKE